MPNRVSVFGAQLSYPTANAAAAVVLCQERRAGAAVRQLVDEFGDVALAHFARGL